MSKICKYMLFERINHINFYFLFIYLWKNKYDIIKLLVIINLPCNSNPTILALN